MPATGTEGYVDPYAPRLTTGPMGAVGSDPISTGNTYNPWATTVAAWTNQSPVAGQTGATGYALNPSPAPTGPNPNPQSNPTPPPASSGGQSYQQQWESLGRTGQAPVGWHGESAGTPGVDEAAINNVYQPTMNYLNQAESAVRQDFPNVLDAAQKAYESAISELSGNKQKNVSTINENVQTAATRKEDALSAARRLYDELRRGYQQRFGGSTSAGQAASELSAVEQQRQMGQTTRDFGTTMRQIETQRSQLETDYQTGSMKILESKQSAIAQANRDFQNQLLSIAGQRAQTESAKAAAKLDALNTLRNQAYTAQQNALTYQQNLDLYYKQQQADLQTYAAKLQMAGQGSASAINQYLPQNYQTPNLQVQSSGGQNTALTGQITKKPEDTIANAAGSIGFNKPVSGYGAYDPYKLGL